MWTEICQGLLVLGWLVRLSLRLGFAVKGRPMEEPSGPIGAILVTIWMLVAGVVLWRAGGISTIVGMP